MEFDIITIFPKMFERYFGESIIKRAQKKRLVKINVHNLRDFTYDKHKSVDDRPYGGGAGMVLKVAPIADAVALILKKWENKKKKGKVRIILFSPKGKKFDQKMARRFLKYDKIIMICGRYEGIDDRVLKYVADEEVSVGEFVLTGGEIPAIMVTDAVARLVPGVIREESLLEESFSGKSKGFLEPPQYTRPEVYSPANPKLFGKSVSVKWRVPKVLLSGDPKKIEEWKEKFIK